MHNYKKLDVFKTADGLALKVYGLTKGLPNEERFGLQSQLRRAAVSVSTNIVEGSERESKAEYVRFLAIAKASAAEVRYLLSVARRLEYVDGGSATSLEDAYDGVVRSLQSLILAQGAS